MMTAATEDSLPRTVELLSALLARRTEPGHGHVIFSASDFESLRKDLKDVAWTRPLGSALRALRSDLSDCQFDVDIVVVIHHASKGSTGAEWSRWEARAVRELLPSSPGEPLVEVAREASGHVTRSVAALADRFVDLLTEHAPILDKLNQEEAEALGRRAAEQVAAAARWAHVVGDRLDTSQVTALLGVSRQALAKRQRAGSLLGLPGDRTTWYPAWQFDVEAGSIRPEVRDIIGAFRDALDDVDPLMIASWATTPQAEDLDGYTPAEWLRTRDDTDRLRRAAVRAAARLAR